MNNRELTHDQVKALLLQDEAVKREYEVLEPEYEIIRQLIQARIGSRMTQKELAERIGTKQCNISRLESGGYNPHYRFLKKLLPA